MTAATVREIAERVAGEVCSYDWYDCTQPGDTEAMAPGVANVIEAAIREACAPLVIALREARVVFHIRVTQSSTLDTINDALAPFEVRP